MRPPPHEARERLLVTMASCLIFEMRDSHATVERKGRLAALEGCLRDVTPPGSHELNGSAPPEPLDLSRHAPGCALVVAPGSCEEVCTCSTDAAYGVEQAFEADGIVQLTPRAMSYDQLVDEVDGARSVLAQIGELIGWDRKAPLLDAVRAYVALR